MEINAEVLNSKRPELITQVQTAQRVRKLLLMESLLWGELSRFSKEVRHKSPHVFTFVFWAAKVQRQVKRSRRGQVPG